MAKKRGNLLQRLKGYINRLLPDYFYFLFRFRKYMGRFPHIKAPKTFNEKLIWLCLYDRNPLRTILADKYSVREYVKERVGSLYLNEMIGMYYSPDEIDFDTLPDSFVLKGVHGSQWNILCEDKSTLNYEKTRQKIAGWLKRNYYYDHREWQYKDIRPGVICEKFLTDRTGELRDYKIFCFDGIPRFIQLHFGRFGIHHLLHFDIEWNLIPVSRTGYPVAELSIKKPEKLNEMLEVATKLARGWNFVRVDLYLLNEEKVLFGEMTFTPAGSKGKLEPESYDELWGSWIDLSMSKKSY